MSTGTMQQVPTGTYSLDPVHSTFAFAIRHNGVSTFRGRIEQVDASLEDGILSGTAHVDSITAAIPSLKQHLLSADFFNAAETPTVTFRSGEIHIAEDGRVEIAGELTLRGVAELVFATGTFATGQNAFGTEVVGFDLEATVDRRDYGLGWQAQLPTGGKVLGWDVVLQVSLELAKA